MVVVYKPISKAKQTINQPASSTDLMNYLLKYGELTTIRVCLGDDSMTTSAGQTETVAIPIGFIFYVVSLDFLQSRRTGAAANWIITALIAESGILQRNVMTQHESYATVIQQKTFPIPIKLKGNLSFNIASYDEASEHWYYSAAEWIMQGYLISLADIEKLR